MAFGSYEVGAVQRLPYIDAGGEAGSLIRELTWIRMSGGERSEVDHLFVSPWAEGIGEEWHGEDLATSRRDCRSSG